MLSSIPWLLIACITQNVQTLHRVFTFFVHITCVLEQTASNWFEIINICSVHTSATEGNLVTSSTVTVNIHYIQFITSLFIV